VIQHHSGEHAGAASDIEPGLARRRGQPVQERCGGGAAPASHEALVGLAIVEAVGHSGHAAPSFQLEAACLHQAGVEKDFLPDIRIARLPLAIVKKV
jgi:hypothetical protein